MPCMDKLTPKSDLFKANRDRAAPLLARGTHKIQKLGSPPS